MAELLGLSEWHRQSALGSLISEAQAHLLTAQEVSDAIEGNEASGFTLDTYDFSEDDIQILEDEIRVDFAFCLTGEAHNPFNSTTQDAAIEGTATLVIDAAGCISFEDIAVDDTDCEEDDVCDEDSDED